MFLEGGYGGVSPSASLHRHSSARDVSYSCGYCGYSLNLSSSQRNTTNIGPKYRKAIKKGIVSFYSIDESRFSLIDDLSCLPYINSKISWGIFRHKTKLQCRKCGTSIGFAYEEAPPSPSTSSGSDCSDSSSRNGIENSKRYKIKISSLQPTLEESGTALIVR